MARLNYIAPIQWHEGMMLVPQHFQQNDLRQEQINKYYFSRLVPYFWGVQKFEIDQVSFPDGLIRILELEAIMPDGTVISYHHQIHTHVLPLEIDLSAYKKAFDNSDQYIYLTLPEWVPGISPLSGDKPRYYTHPGDNVIDFNTQDNITSIPRLYPRIQLHLGTIPPEQHAAFPLMKISNQDGTFMEKSFQPPFFHVKKISLIGELCNGIARRIREKAIFLSEKWQNESDKTLNLETKTILIALLQSLPSLEAHLGSELAHPYVLYLEFCKVLGNLSIMSLSSVNASLPAYNHHEILLSYTHLFDRIKRLLDAVEQTYTILSFDNRDRLFSLKLGQNLLRNKLYIGVKNGSGMSDSQLHEWVKDCIIASDSAVKQVRDKRITGAPRNLVHNVQSIGLLPTRNVTIYEVACEERYIQGNEALNIFNPADTPELRPTGIILYIQSKGVE